MSSVGSSNCRWADEHHAFRQLDERVAYSASMMLSKLGLAKHSDAVWDLARKLNHIALEDFAQLTAEVIAPRAGQFEEAVPRIGEEKRLVDYEARLPAHPEDRAPNKR